jgi:hypothetical protein
MIQNIPVELMEVVQDLADGEIIDELWECDIISSLADLISNHNEFRKEPPNPIDTEPKFENISYKKEKLSNLLYDDFKYLSKSSMIPENLKDNIFFLQVHAPNPNAQVLELNYCDESKYVILFRTPLIYFLHSFYSKFNILTSPYTHAECLPMHDSVMNSESYSDFSLWLKIFQDFEVFFYKSKIVSPISPPHLASPYNYCEAIEGARRFLLAHEIGHLIYSRDSNNELVTHFIEIGLDKQIAEKYAEELWCDSFALKTILSIYEESSGSLLWELENTLHGILLFFSAFDLVEVSLSGCGYFSFDRLPPGIRKEYMQRLIYSEDVKLSPNQLRVFSSQWNEVILFNRFLRGELFPLHLGLKCHQELRKFEYGQKALQAFRDYQIPDSILITDPSLYCIFPVKELGKAMDYKFIQPWYLRLQDIMKNQNRY